ncbi:hypothetical protein ABIE26_003689 [Pedobacter africanus]|uniref:Uncharacterized protein n=1 Tax=Pedobacter africanus TaxID=151894 RepID=A0ACC6L0J2_9SPHI|nr:sugar-binding domain-containing protein [Pedobacter africanus]MDR6784991.1 hypothetical protein [Pedobacter africanus]
MNIIRCMLSAAVMFAFTAPVLGQDSWKLQPVAVQTRWAKNVSPANALKEYPRPQMERNNWVNLNGLWDYAITDNGAARPSRFDGRILVPYPIESALSGVKKALLPSQNLWYKRLFTRPALKTGEKVKLNFGAVDYEATVFVNGTQAGKHEGGYTAFSFDITALLKAGENEIVVKVFDPSGEGVGPHGKQVLKPESIYYTPSSGIWQTVWMETVPEVHVEELVMRPDIDKGILDVVVKGKGKPEVVVAGCSECGVLKQVQDDDRTTTITVKVPKARLWSPGNPFLYDITVKLGNDVVKSYFGMRKISVVKDAAGVDRIMLNNKPYYNLGTLDQGFWPEGLYTAPTDEALAFDIKAIKAMGFNTIRKHIKVEPARWYYHADKLGMLVWQDMVNPNQGLPQGAKAAFEAQSAETLSQLHNHPSIVCWVLFNEKWGQYDQQRLTEWIKSADPSRIVNGHSGELLYVNEVLRSPSPNAYVSADMTDVHSYPDPMMPIRIPGMAQVCGEFGGIGVFIPEHQWLTGSAWGYIQEKPAALMAKYNVMNQHLQLFEKEGLSGSVYTQPFDVEGEQNGLMTYDREVIKIPFAALRQIHAPLNPEAALPGWVEMTKGVVAKDADLTEPGILYSNMLPQYIMGKRDAAFLKKMAMMATQAGDKLGAELAGKAYIAGIKMPLSEEDINAVVQFSKSTKDAGFKLMHDNAAAFQKAMGDRKYTVAMMNMILKGEMEPLMNAADQVDWAAVEAAVKPYGLPGEEILLRAQTVGYFNKQDWKNYAPVAKAYLEKFGTNVSENEKTMFQKALDEHKKN